MQQRGEKRGMIPRGGIGGAIRRMVEQVVGTRKDRGPIATVAALETFVSTRASFIAQHALFGYLKARIGTRYPSMFEDDVFAASIRAASMRVYAACLSDLAIHSAARALAGAPDADAARRDVALRCFARGLRDNRHRVVEGFVPEDVTREFVARAAVADWGGVAQGPDVFTKSPADLVRWAPIAPELKRHDAEFVRNSIRFAWGEIRRELGRRLDAGAVAADARSAAPAPEG